MKLEEAIEKVGDKWQTGGYFTADEICDLNDMLLELQELRKRDAERANGREEFMTVVYDELSDDSDNCRANRIIDAADEYAEEVKEKKEKCKWIKYDYRTMCPKYHDIDNPYWRIPENYKDVLKYCPYCGKEIDYEWERGSDGGE